MGDIDGNDNEGPGQLGTGDFVAIGLVAGAMQVLATRLAGHLLGKMSADEFDALLNDVVVELKNGSAQGVTMEDEAVGMGEAIEAVEDVFANMARDFREASE
ncbi:MAG: hypothetical protein Q8M31_21825 [Beijerinckiaceae bacterium]|nr:hypothetical protein [Beijerinckiaceae bacterium]